MTSSEKHPCPKCNSSDAYAIYEDDGHGHCFSCGYHTHPDGTEATMQQTDERQFSGLSGEPQALLSRNIPQEICQKYSYQIGSWRDEKVHIAPFYYEGRQVGQKLRFKDKRFQVLGKVTDRFFGQHLFGGGKWVVVTEGEIDAMSVATIFRGWPAVSLPCGAQGAEGVFKAQIEWLESFDTVKICFDQDEQGQAAAIKCAQVLSPGKAQIVSLPLKDASDMIQANRAKELSSGIFNAAVWRPDGIVPGDTLWEYLTQEDSVAAIPLPWEGLQHKTGGLRSGELWTLCAGTGAGKTQLTRELVYHLLQCTEINIGIVSLEESMRETAYGLMSLHAEIPHWDMTSLSAEELEPHYKATIGCGRVFLFDHFGSFDDPTHLQNKIRYMASHLKCKWIIFDHLTLALSGTEEKGSSERKSIDVLLTSLRQLIAELGIGMICVSHLSRHSGRPAEAGGEISLNMLRGSHSIGQLSNICIALERNISGDNDDANQTTCRILKNRWNGRCGPSSVLGWDESTGRLTEIATRPPNPDDESDTDNIPF